jgi:hypothetical protein
MTCDAEFSGRCAVRPENAWCQLSVCCRDTHGRGEREGAWLVEVEEEAVSPHAVLAEQPYELLVRTRSDGADVDCPEFHRTRLHVNRR